MQDASRPGIWTLANALTSLRLVGAVCMLFLDPCELPFLIVYTVSGLSDGLDGFVARKTGTASEFGSKLDSVADLSFYAVMLVRIFPLLWKLLPRWMWILVAAVLLLRAGVYAAAALRLHRFASAHTLLNKLTGFLVFCIPYLMRLRYFWVYCVGLGAVSGVSAVRELWGYLREPPVTGSAVSGEPENRG